MADIYPPGYAPRNRRYQGADQSSVPPPDRPAPPRRRKPRPEDGAEPPPPMTSIGRGSGSRPAPVVDSPAPPMPMREQGGGFSVDNPMGGRDWAAWNGIAAKAAGAMSNTMTQAEWDKMPASEGENMPNESEFGQRERKYGPRPANDAMSASMPEPMMGGTPRMMTPAVPSEDIPKYKLPTGRGKR